MAKVALVPLESCTKCDHFKTQNVQCSDSFCRPEKWTCQHPDVNPNNNVIDGYHDMNDKDQGIPNFCPFLSDDQREPEHSFVEFEIEEIKDWMLGVVKNNGFSEIVDIKELVDDKGEFSFFRCKVK